MVGERRHLREVGDDENLGAASELGQPASDLHRRGATDAGIDLVEDERRDRARAGEGPTLIETKTYRYYDHSGLAGAKPGVLGAFGLPYRSDMELRAWLAEDPIPKLRTQLIGGGILTAAQADAIEADIKKRVAQSIEFAQKSPSPAREAGLENVFASTKVAATQFLKS